MRQLIVITPTVERGNRLRYLARVSDWLRGQQDLIWIVVEDGAELYKDVQNIVTSAHVEHHVYFHHGPTRNFGNEQRNAALEMVVTKEWSGVVYFADDDNAYDVRLFDELRRVRRIGVLPVGNLGPHGIEGPIVRNGRIIGWDAGWPERRFPVDMAGFAFDASVLRGLRNRPLFSYRGHGGETEFLESLIHTEDEMEPLCTDCTRCYVWHNQPL